MEVGRKEVEVSVGEAAELSPGVGGEVSDGVSDEVSDEVSDAASDYGAMIGVSDDYGAIGDQDDPPLESEEAAEAAALEGSVDNVIDGPYCPAPYRPASPRTMPAAAAAKYTKP